MSVEVAHQLLQYWTSRHKAGFDPNAMSSFEATVAHSIENVSTGLGVCSCKVLITPRLQNNYGTMNGGGMAALACIVALTALETMSARSGVTTSSSMEYLSAMPGNAVVEVLATVSAVTSSTAAVDVILRDAKTQRLVAKGRYTEQAPHGIRARASAYLHNTAEAAKSAVQRLQHSAESITGRSISGTLEGTVSEAKQTASAYASTAADSVSVYTSEHRALSDAKQAASAYVSNATAAVKAAAQRLQHAAENALQALSEKAGQHGYIEGESTSESDPEAASSVTQAASSAQAQASDAASATASAAQSASESASRAAAKAASSMQSSTLSQLHKAVAQGSPDNNQSEHPPEPQHAQQGNLDIGPGAQHAQQSNLDIGPGAQHAQQGELQTGPAAQRAKQGLLQRAAMVTKSFREDDCTCFDTTLGCMLQDIQVGAGSCTAVLPTTPRLADSQGMLHPGCYCSLVDVISTTALAAADKRPAVSVTISVDFYSALPIGEDLEVESHVVKTGKSLTFAEVNFRQKSSGALLAQGSHVEYSAGGATYPDSIEEYHRQQISRQQSSKL